MEDGNAQMAAMQAQFEETIAKLRENLTPRLRVQEAANKTMREEREKTAKREATTMGNGAAAKQGPGGQGVSTSVNDSLIRLHYFSPIEQCGGVGGGGGMLPDFFFCSLFPVQQTTSGIGHRVK